MKIKVRTILFWFLTGLLLMLSSIIYSVSDWFDLRFGVSFEEILFTITSPLNGSDVSFLDEAVEYVLPFAKNSLFIFLSLILLFLILYYIMDSSLISQADEESGSIKNRIFTSLDFFPTTLSAMGFEIEGNRLGLGTDLFSDTQTLAEQLGYDAFNNELGKYSKYYEENFK